MALPARGKLLGIKDRSANTRGRSASATFADEVERGLSVPLPGAGDTSACFRYLERLAAADLALACPMQGRPDAEAILAEAGRGAPTGALLCVWAEHSREHVLLATQTDDGWRVRGSKPRASGASTVTHALVTTEARAGSRLFARASGMALAQERSASRA